MKKVTFTIYGWKDLSKWFWDKFCFPRRKLVTEWLDYHNENIRSRLEPLLIEALKLDIDKKEDEEKLVDLNERIIFILKEETEITTDLIITCK